MKRPAFSFLVAGLLLIVSAFAANDPSRPNIILVMADDMGWGQTGYNGHPILQTPNLDAMAAAGLRFDRFYAGAPNCSPTRATVMTGRSNDRAGVQNHGYALRRQEKTIAQALRSAGYATGHFGKWHLNGFSGPGAPVLATDDHNPGEFGFEEWVSVTNFFERDPLLSRKGKFEEFKGDSSEVIVEEALKFIRRSRDTGKPVLALIWYGSPHAPYIAAPADKTRFASLDQNSQNHYGELVAMDRSIGTLRKGLRDLGIAENTLVWFCSDNGGLPNITPETVGGFRGFKNTMYEGGLRVPAIIEWPAGIKTPRISRYPSGTVDIFPTVAEITRLPASSMLKPIDGLSLKPLFTAELKERPQPLAFRHTGRAAMVDNRYKIVSPDIAAGKFELYDLEADPKETKDLISSKPDIARRMQEKLLAWNESVKASVAGRDYPEGKVHASEPPTRSWIGSPEYEKYLPQLKERPEYRDAIAKGPPKAKKAK